MDIRYYSLGNVEKNRLVRIIRVLFGAVCIAVAAFWLIFNISTIKNTGTLWMTIFFLTAFGFYQIWAGIGKAERFIEIRKDTIALKKYIFLQPVIIPATETEKIEFFTLKVIFRLGTDKKILLRLGTMYYESNDNIMDDLAKYADENKIPTEVIEEKM
jgi:hypothetical protein